MYLLGPPGKNTGVGFHFLLHCMKVKSESEVSDSSDPMDCSLPESSFHRIFQARILECGAIAFSDDQPRQHFKKQRHYFANKVHLVKAMVFPVVRYGCESWTIKKAECQRIDAFELGLEKTLESPLDCKEIRTVNPKGNRS